MKALLTSFLLLFSFQVQAQVSLIDGILIRAESTEGFTDKDQFLLKGHVQVAFQGQTIQCDEALIDLKKKTILAKGNIIIDDAQTHLEADQVLFNYKTNTGTIENGFIQSGQLVIEGRKIEKIADKTYVAQDAEFTSCSTCPPGWSFSGREIEAELGGYAKIWRPVFKVGGWSILPLPWLLVPLKTDRQSGLLVPSYEFTQRGQLALSESFFWAIDRSQDATLSLTYHELLGLKWGGEYRYVLTDTSRGNFRGSFIKDRKFPDELFDSYSRRSEITRWFFEYGHHFNLPDNFVQRLHYTDVSDLEYLRDFPNDLVNWGDPALENRASITKNYDWLHLSAEASMFKNLLLEYPVTDNSTSVHKVPEIQIKTTEMALWDHGPLFSTHINSTHFVRDDFSYDDLTTDSDGNRVPITDDNYLGEYQRDGNFDPSTDLVRTGHRLDLSSSLKYPLLMGKRLRLAPSLTYREMQYRFQIDQQTSNQDFGPSAAQRYIQTNVMTETEFSHIFGEERAYGNKYKHSIIPQVTYSRIPWIRRPSHPFFGNYAGQPYLRSLEPISDQDLNGVNKVQFDYNDRVFDRELLTLNLSNQLVRKEFLGGTPSYKKFAFFDLSQSYDFNEERTDNPQPWTNIIGNLGLDLKYFYGDTLTSYNPYASLLNTSSRLRIRSPVSNNYFQVSYSKHTQVDEDNQVLEDTKTENFGFSIGTQTTYLDLTANLDYSAVKGGLESWDYIARLKPPGNCWYIEFMHRQILAGEVNFKANFSFNFDGI